VPEHPLRWLSSFLTYAPIVEPEEFRRCPVVLVAPTADRWLQLEPSLDFYRRLPGDKQLHMLADASHLPADGPGVAALVDGLIGC
jgi:alpha-beta hydrolase superfamily lysophospholipase